MRSYMQLLNITSPAHTGFSTVQASMAAAEHADVKDSCLLDSSDEEVCARQRSSVHGGQQCQASVWVLCEGDVTCSAYNAVCWL